MKEENFMKAKKITAVLLAVCLAAGAMSGCGKSSSTASQSASKSASRQEINFWYHSADTVTDAYFKDLFVKLNKQQDNYTFSYTSFAFKDFQNKFQIAVTTNTVPDVVSLSFSNIATFVSQNSLLPMNDYVNKISEYKDIDGQIMKNLKDMYNGKIYGIPYAYNQEVAWYNTKLFQEKGIQAPPTTQTEFLNLCKKYADSKNGKYFYSLRGVRPYDSLLAWLFTYTNGAGYKGSWFDENGKCILSKPEFAKALDAYVNLYKSKEVSGNSVNNNYSEVVAEFGSGVSMYIIHNSSSESTHVKNLGEGNFASARVLANDQGHYFASGLQPNVYCLPNHGTNHDYTGALALISYLTNAENEGAMCQTIGRIPCNKEVSSQDWYKKSKNMKLYESYLSDDNYFQIENPYWLSDFSSFITNDMTADFQAVLLGKMTSQACLQKWASAIDKYQQAYLAKNK